jgi:dihydrofolate reductase
MRKVTLGLAVTLDGYIEGLNGEYDWCFTDQDYGITEFLESIDAIFYGRKSFEVAGGNLYPDKKAYIFSNSLKTASEGTELVSGDIIQAVKKIKQQPGKNIWLFGGASLTTAFMNADLVDELWLSVHPLLLGSGKLLFQQIQERKYFKLVKTKHYETGLVSLWYTREEQEVKK